MNKKGVVYILHNDGATVRCKIGRTSRAKMRERLLELNRTSSVFARWDCHCAVEFEDAEWAVKMMREAFKEFNSRKNGGIFLVDSKAMEPYLHLLQRYERLWTSSAMAISDLPPLRKFV